MAVKICLWSVKIRGFFYADDCMATLEREVTVSSSLPLV